MFQRKKRKEKKRKESYIKNIIEACLVLWLWSFEFTMRVQILDKAVCVSLRSDDPQKDMNPSLLSSTLSK